MEDKNFIINAGPKGTFAASGNYQTTPEQVDQLLEKIKNEKPEKVTLYFHGGLVSEKTGLDTARKLYPQLKTDDHYPVFLVWETGLIEILKGNIESVGNTQLFRKLLKLVIKVIGKRLGVRFSGDRSAGFMANDMLIEAELQRERPFEELDRILDRSLRSLTGAGAIEDLPERDDVLERILEDDFNDLLSKDTEAQELLANPKENKARGFLGVGTAGVALAKVGFRVVKRFINKRDHGFFPTIVEEIFRQFYIAEIGSLVWNGMKVKAGLVWRSNAGLSGVHQHAGRYFLDRLVAYINSTAHNGKPTVKVNLVGHSAGGIVICELLKEAAKAFPDLKFEKLILMAPACRTDLFINEVVSHPERYNNLRCFTMSDQNERKDMLVPYLYTRSLLYLISGVLEAEGEGFDEYILGMERYLSGKPPYSQHNDLALLRAYFAAADKRLVLSESLVDAESGFRTSSLKHGDFDDNPLTIESLCYILNTK